MSAHDRIADAIADVGADHKPPGDWEAKVWAQIAREQPASRRRWLWWLAPAALAAVAAAFLLWPRPEPRPPLAVAMEVKAGATIKRSHDATLGDSLTVRGTGADAVWIYRDDRHITRCFESCTVTLDAPGRYQVVVVRGPVNPATGVLDDDLAAVKKAGGAYVMDELEVR